MNVLPGSSALISLDAGIVVFFHLLPLLVLMPAPGLDRVPASVRVCFCLALTVCLVGALPPAQSASPVTATVATDISTVVGHFLLGLALALGVQAAFAGLHIGGTLIDAQAGTNAAAIFSPSQGSSGVFTEFLVLAAAVTVLLSDAVLMLLSESLSLAPTEFLTDATQWELLITSVSAQMAAGFLLTLPVVSSLWLLDVIAAASSRLLPQANVYFLFLPIKALFATLFCTAYLAAFLGMANHLVAASRGG